MQEPVLGPTAASAGIEPMDKTDSGTYVICSLCRAPVFEDILDHWSTDRRHIRALGEAGFPRLVKPALVDYFVPLERRYQ